MIFSKPIVLVGMMGCGKSTIGKIVAEKLKWIFIDTQWMAMMPKLFPLDYVVADVAFSAVMYAISGAAIGWALNRFK